MITAEQRELRRKYIGSSDSAAILGLSPFANIADVYWNKVGHADQPENPSMKAGNQLEAVVLDYAEETIGKELLRDQLTIDDIFCANHDALVCGTNHGVEAKTSGITGPGVNDQWGEPGTDQVPEHVLVQCQHQIMVAKLQMVWVPALIGGRGFQMYEVHRDDQLIESMKRRLRKFWEEHVLCQMPPEDALPSIDVIRRVRRVPEKITQMPGNVVEKWQEAKARLKVAKQEQEAAEALLLTYMGDAEAGDSDMGRVTFYEQKRAGYTVEASSFRVLRHAKRRI